MRAKVVAIAIPLLCLGALHEQPRPDEIRLSDGRVLVGTITRRGDVLEVTTRDGVVHVRDAEVEKIRTDTELSAALQTLARGRKDDAFSNLQLAETAFAYGLTREMWGFVDRCVEQVDPAGDGAAARQLRDLLLQLEPDVLPAELRDAPTATRVRALVRRVRGNTGAGKRAMIRELLVAEQGADQALRTAAKTEPLAEQRLTALSALARRDPKAHGPFVQMRMVADHDKTVRAAAAELVKSHGDTTAAVRRLTAGLLHDAPAIRIRTARALAQLGDGKAIPVLVAAGPLAGTPRGAAGGFGTRSHMMSTTTQSYIRDFDVEIAQAAAVANPIIGNARSGVVLDVNVPAVITQRVEIELAYRRALRELTGDDPGAAPQAWASWLSRRGERDR